MTLDAPHLLPGRVAAVGVTACVPALLLVVGGLTYSLTGFALFDAFTYRLGIPPGLMLGGLGFAFLLNLLPVVRLEIHTHGPTLFHLEVRRHPANLAVLVLSGGLFAMIFAYALVENGLVRLPW